MNRTSEARSALKAECESSIQDIRTQPGRHDCKAHDAIGRGLITLLRCQAARMDEEEFREKGMRRRSLIFGSVAGATVAGAWTAARKLLNL